jgi:hypothetical protein
MAARLSVKSIHFRQAARERNAVAVRDVIQEVNGHLLVVHLCAVVIERHQKEGRERVGLLLTLLFGILPRAGSQRLTLEVTIALEGAAHIVLTDRGGRCS